MRKVVILLKSLFMASCATLIFGVITWQLQRLDSFVPVSLPPWMAVGGIILMIAGEAIQTADFLTEDQKRDIFYNNAVRFLRLSKEAIAKHHGK